MLRNFILFRDCLGLHLVIEPGIAQPELFSALHQNLSYFVSSGLVLDELKDSTDSVLRDPRFDDRHFFSYRVEPSKQTEKRSSILIGHYSEGVPKLSAVVGFFDATIPSRSAERGLKTIDLRFSISDVGGYGRKFEKDGEKTKKYVSAYQTFLDYMGSREGKPRVYFSDFKLPKGTHVTTYLPRSNYDHVLRALHRKVDPLITYPFVILGPSFDLGTREPCPDKVDVTICTSNSGNHSGVLPDLEKVVSYLTDKERFETDELTGKTMGRTAVVSLPSPYDLGPYKNQLMRGFTGRRTMVCATADFT